jgi:hypothetical protein
MIGLIITVEDEMEDSDKQAVLDWLLKKLYEVEVLVIEVVRYRV